MGMREKAGSSPALRKGHGARRTSQRPNFLSCETGVLYRWQELEFSVSPEPYPTTVIRVANAGAVGLCGEGWRVECLSLPSCLFDYTNFYIRCQYRPQ